MGLGSASSLPKVRESTASDPLAEAAAAIERAGIPADFTNLTRRTVVGGRHRITIGPIEAFEDGFTLWQAEDGTYHAVVGGNGQHGIRSSATTLEHAVDFVLAHYTATAPR